MFPFNPPIILENDTVLLRNLQVDDYQHLLPYAVQEPDLWQFSLTSGGSPQALQQYIDEAKKQQTLQTAYPFIVFDKRTQQYAGSTRFYDIQNQHNTTQLGFTWYGKAFWSTGLNRNCKFLMLQYAFDTLGMQRVEFRADSRNARSIAAMQKIGCTPEGVLRSNCKGLLGRRDSIILSILQHEWQTEKREQLFKML